MYPAEDGVAQVETLSRQDLLTAAPRRLGDCVIPVLDLRDGRVVHANGGNRSAYPILKLEGYSAGEPLAVLDWLCMRYPFRSVYIADLDALSDRPPQMEVLQALTRAQPDCRLHVDAPGQRPTLGIYPILATERLVGDCMWTAQTNVKGGYWLSIDHRDQRLLGQLPSPECLAGAHAVIDMNLNCVGKRMTARERLARVHPTVRAESVKSRILAGGIRTADDIRAAWHAGFRAVLCGSALYSGTLDGAVLAEAL